MDNNPQPGPFPGAAPVLSPPRGAMFVSEHVGRTMKIYPILESEMQSLALLNDGATVATSLGIGSLTFVLGVVINAMMVDPPTAGSLAARTMSLWVGLPLAAVFLALAAWLHLRRHSELARILRQSTQGPPVAA